MLHLLFSRRAEFGYDPCRMYDRVSPVNSSDSCLASDFDRHSLTNCSQFVYDRSEFYETITTDLDLVCDNVEKRHFLGSVLMMGLTMGSMLGGPLV